MGDGAFLLKLSEGFLGAAAAETLLLLVPAAVCAAVRWRPVVLMTITGGGEGDGDIRATAFITDVLYLIGLLSVIITLWMFYHFVLPYIKDGTIDHGLSLVIAILLLLTVNLSMLEPIFPFRFFLLAGVLGVVWIKNRRVMKRYKSAPYGQRIEFWFRNARWTFLGTAFGASLFFLVFHPSYRLDLFRIMFAQEVRVGPPYEISLSAVAFLIFDAVSLRSLIRNGIFFWKQGDRDRRFLSEGGSR